jgi:phosphoglycerate dehydrogenase-like enzyme
MAPIPPTPIKLAILDDYQDVAKSHFVRLETQFEITVFRDTLLPYNHPSTPDHAKQELVERLKPFTVISTMRERTPFPEALLEKLPNLKLLLTTQLKNASFDLVAAKRLGIQVTGTVGQWAGNNAPPTKRPRGLDSTSEHIIALILGISRRLAFDDLQVKTGGWETGLATGLGGKVFGAVGLGRLGVTAARILYQIFGMRVVAWSTSLTQEVADEKAKAAGLPVEDEDGEKVFKVVSKEELFKQADIVSVHYVLSERSRGIVSRADLSLLKKSAFFINTSRGPLVDEAALLDTLETGAIRGAAVDVFDIEPLPNDSRWRTQKWGTEGRSHVLLSPHMGYVEEGIIGRWYVEQAEITRRWHKGEELMHVMA